MDRTLRMKSSGAFNSLKKNMCTKLETHFVGRTNVIFERARFNKRVQGALEESVIDVIESLYELAETCMPVWNPKRRINTRPHRCWHS